MKKFLHSPNGAYKWAAPIIVSAFGLLSNALSQTPPCVYAVAGTMVINNSGHNYVVGDRLRAIGGTTCIEAFPLSLQVNSVDATGRVTGATIIVDNSNGYVTQPSNPISFGGSATGSNFKASFSFH